MAMIVFGLYLNEDSPAPYFVEKGSQFWYLYRHWRMYQKTGKHFNEGVQEIFDTTKKKPHIRYFGVYKDKEMACQAEANVIRYFGRQNNGTGVLLNNMDGGRKKFTESSNVKRSKVWKELTPEEYQQRCANMSMGKRRKASQKKLIRVIQHLICLKQAESR